MFIVAKGILSATTFADCCPEQCQRKVRGEGNQNTQTNIKIPFIIQFFVFPSKDRNQWLKWSRIVPEKRIIRQLYPKLLGNIRHHDLDFKRSAGEVIQLKVAYVKDDN